jgi:hypothetical protein
MTIVTLQETLTTSPSLIAGPDIMAQFVTVHNNSSNQQVFVGGSNVTTSNGFHIDGKEEHTFTLYPGDALYGVSSGSDTVSVLIQKQR